MEFDFLYWTAIKVFGGLAIVGVFVWYFVSYYKKHTDLPKSVIPYLLACVLILVSVYGMVRVNPPEVQQRTIKTFDTQQVYEVPEIKLQTKQQYKPTTE